MNLERKENKVSRALSEKETKMKAVPDKREKREEKVV